MLNFLLVHDKLFFVFGLGVLTLAASFIAIWRSANSKKYLPRIIFAFFIINIFWSAAKTLNLWNLWSSSADFSKFLAPPYATQFFLNYSYFYFFRPWILDAVAAIVAALIIFSLNKLFRERFFYHEEPLLAFIGTMVNQWPGFIVYFGAVFIAAVFFGFIILFLNRFEHFKETRFAFRGLWLPVALFVLLVGGIIIKMTPLHYLLL